MIKLTVFKMFMLACLTAITLPSYCNGDKGTDSGEGDGTGLFDTTPPTIEVNYIPSANPDDDGRTIFTFHDNVRIIAGSCLDTFNINGTPMLNRLMNLASKGSSVIISQVDSQTVRVVVPGNVTVYDGYVTVHDAANNAASATF